MADLARMSALGVNPEYWRGRTVFVTGHTGFMGGWLALWLARGGANVTGFALAPPTEPSFFEAVGLKQDLESHIADVRDGEALAAAVAAANPEFIFHLAAQPLVRAAHAEPAFTFATNVMGTVNLLQAARAADAVRAIVVVTTDKVYDNREWDWGYRENDRLGGREPYGASKACAEFVVDAFRQSYLLNGDSAVGVATVRAGNVIGGGDWARDRLVPDAIRAFSDGEILALRNPQSIRPWQHVLEPVHGMLMLAERLCAEPIAFSNAWNFGPTREDTCTVERVVGDLARLWGKGAEWRPDPPSVGPREAGTLALDSAKAIAELGWRPVWALAETLARTATWYRSFYAGGGVRALSLEQIDTFAGWSAHHPIAMAGG